MSNPDSAYDAWANAWAAELRAGSTRTWAEFRSAAEVSATAPAGPGPRAANLELVRRLSALEVPDLAELADLVLATPGTGRGRVDVPLPWDEPASFGTPAVEPDQLPADELLRVCTGVLVTLLARAKETDSAPVPRRWRPWRRGVVVLGASTTAARLRDAVVAQGLNSGGPRSTYLVVAEPFEALMAQRWAARVGTGSAMRWQRMWRMASSNDRIPPGARIPALADRLADRFGPSRVHVLLAADPREASALAADVAGVRAELIGERPGSGPLATDLLRRLNPLLVLALGDERRSRVIRELWPRLADLAEDPRLGAPAAAFGWAVAAGTRMAERLDSARYAVHGEPELLIPVPDQTVRRRLAAEDVLAFAVQVLANAWAMERSGQTGVV